MNFVLERRFQNRREQEGILMLNHVISSHQTLDFPKSNCVENYTYITSVTVAVLVLQVHKTQ